MLGWIAYLLVATTVFVLRLPSLAVVAVAAWAVALATPNPLDWLRVQKRMRALRALVDAYPADLLARRDLARICLEQRRPREAVSLLEESIAKGLVEPEVFYLLGLARLRSGDANAALDPIVRSVIESERLLLGDPYFIAAEALTVLHRWDEAEDALDRGLGVNTSHVPGRVLLARVRAKRGDHEGARHAAHAAIEAWRDLPEFLRKKYLRAYLAARVWSFMER